MKYKMIHLELNKMCNNHGANRKSISNLIKINLESENSLVKKLNSIDQ